MKKEYILPKVVSSCSNEKGNISAHSNLLRGYDNSHSSNRSMGIQQENNQSDITVILSKLRKIKEELNIERINLLNELEIEEINEKTK